MDYRERIESMLKDPESLIRIKPFTRGSDNHVARESSVFAQIGDWIKPALPSTKWQVIPQGQFLLELDPNCHKVLFDDNVPTITMKLKDGGYVNIEYKKMAVPFQEIIKNKHVLHLCGNKMQFTLIDAKPNERQREDFVTFKQYWAARNQDGMRTKMVDAQMSVGSAGLLYYFDRRGQVKSRLLSYMDGFILCPHDDENGDRLMECVYYESDGVKYLDCYDDEYITRFTSGEIIDGEVDMGWHRYPSVKHGFSEIPLVTKRGKVAWDNVQNIIEVYEVIYNIFLVVQKRHGWGILYIKGKFNNDGQTIAGAVVLNDTNPDSNGSAEFKQAPTPDGMLQTLELMEETIQKGSGTTFILPKDIRTSGDTSGVAIQITQSLDNEESLRGTIEWQNVADKMCRLFKEGLAKELVSSGVQPTAVTDFQKLHISAYFKEWKPRSDSEYNTMLEGLKNSGLISTKTGIQKNTESTPDEEARIAEERETLKQEEIAQATVSINENEATE